MDRTLYSIERLLSTKKIIEKIIAKNSIPRMTPIAMLQISSNISSHVGDLTSYVTDLDVDVVGDSGWTTSIAFGSIPEDASA